MSDSKDRLKARLANQRQKRILNPSRPLKGPEFIYEAASLTNVGQVREHNEDSYASLPDKGIFIVADGMGGHAGGEVASALAVTEVVKMLRSLQSGRHDVNAMLIRESMICANRLIHEFSDSDDNHRGMGTTMDVAWFGPDGLTLGHVGDSGVYRYRENMLKKITSNHTLGQELLDSGLYDNDEMSLMINRNLLTRAMGIDEEVKPDISRHGVRDGDIFLMCSDGLTDMVNEVTIQATMNIFDGNLQQAVEHLVALANDSGGMDNITVVLIRAQERPQYTFELL